MIKMKYWFFSVLIIGLVGLLLFSFSKEKITLKVDNEVNIIDIKNANIIYKDNSSTFKALLANNSNDSKYINNVEILIRDGSQNIIYKFKIKIDKNVSINEKIKLEYKTNYDLSDAISFDYIIN